MKKYNQYTIKNREGQYIKYSTPYSYKMEYTNSLYDVHLWNNKEDAEVLAEYLNEEEQNYKVVMV